MDEHALIAKIRERLARSGPDIALGIGDDAAILAPSARGTVVSVDAVVEGVHFDRRWLAPADIGFRGYAAALSDLAAMNARPRAGLTSFVLPEALADDEVLAIVDGIAEAADAFGAPVIGGNIASGAELSITTTVLGEAPERPLERRGARIGEGVFVTGTVGTAALGLALLAAGEHEREGAAPFVARWRRPRPRFDLADRSGAVATSAIDVSDGLVADLGHIAVASDVGALIECARLPLHAGHDALATALGEDPDLLALGGGEDYELLFTAAADTVIEGATRIGTIVAGDAVRVLDRQGVEMRVERPGHRHR